MNGLERFFDNVLVFKRSGKTDNRGTMSVSFNQEQLRNLCINFEIREQRVYRMPKAGTFYGIHYQELRYPQSKLVSVIQGEGLDYIIDLRRNSNTYGQWIVLELSESNSNVVFIPPGYGHAFLSTKDNTVQLFAVDEYFIEGYSRRINYLDPEIGLTLPINPVILSDNDRNAPILSKQKNE